MPQTRMKALQRAMSVVVQHPKDAAAALKTGPARPLAGIVKPSRTMQPAQRLDVYNSGYLLRCWLTVRKIAEVKQCRLEGNGKTSPPPGP